MTKQPKLTTELNSISFPNSQEWSSLSSGLISGNARIPCLILSPASLSAGISPSRIFYHCVYTVEEDLLFPRRGFLERLVRTRVSKLAVLLPPSSNCAGSPRSGGYLSNYRMQISRAGSKAFTHGEDEKENCSD